MANYFIYEEDTGRIISTGSNGSLPLSEITTDSETQKVGEGLYNPDIYYVDIQDGGIKEKEDYTKTSIPTPCKIYHENTVYDVNGDDSVDIEFDAPGVYWVTVEPENPRYLKKVLKYEVTY